MLNLHEIISRWVLAPGSVQQYVYMTWADGGRMQCVALTHQGDEIWRVELGDFVGPHGFAASSIVVEGIDKIYCLSTDGRAVVIAAQPEFSLLGENDLGGPTYATPAVHGGKLLLRTESTLACLAGEE